MSGPGILARSVVGPAGVAAALTAGRSWGELASSFRSNAAALVAAVASEALGADGSEAPALTRARPRHEGLAPALSADALAGAFPDAGRPALLGLSAGLLQVFDFWEASHEAAQQADDLGERAVSAYWHGVAHRREPDAGNAAYWFRRVGRHEIFGPLAVAARPCVDRAGGGLSTRLLSRGEWDPLAFIEACTRPADQEALLRELQRVELAMLLETSLPRA